MFPKCVVYLCTSGYEALFKKKEKKKKRREKNPPNQHTQKIDNNKKMGKSVKERIVLSV